MGDSRQAMGPRQAESSARPLMGKSKGYRMRTDQTARRTQKRQRPVAAQRPLLSMPDTHVQARPGTLIAGRPLSSFQPAMPDWCNEPNGALACLPALQQQLVVRPPISHSVDFTVRIRDGARHF